MKKLMSNFSKTSLIFAVLLSTISAQGMESKQSWSQWFLEQSWALDRVNGDHWTREIGYGEAIIIRAALHLTGYPALSEKEQKKLNKKNAQDSANNYSDEEILDSDECALDPDEDICLESPQEAPLLLLPQEIIIHIAGYSNPEEKTALMHVCKGLKKYLKNTEALLLENQFTVSETDKIKCMFDCIHAGKMPMITFLLNAGVDVNQKNEDDISLLHSAVQTGNLNIIQLLINAGAEINEVNASCLEKGYAANPLHCALKHNKINAANLLITHGADINHANSGNYNNSILHYASQEGDMKVATLALGFGADPNQANGYEDYPLHVALTWGNIDVAKLLITHGATNQINYTGDTPLHMVSEVDVWDKAKGHIEIVKLLLASAMVNLNHINDRGQTPLGTALKNDHNSDIADLLTQAGAI